MKLKTLAATLVAAAVTGAGYSAYGQADMVLSYKVSVSPRIWYTGNWPREMMNTKMRQKAVLLLPVVVNPDWNDVGGNYIPYFVTADFSPVLMFYWKAPTGIYAKYFNAFEGQAGPDSDLNFYAASYLYNNNRRLRVEWSGRIFQDYQGLTTGIDSAVLTQFYAKFNQQLPKNYDSTNWFNSLVPKTLNSTGGNQGWGRWGYMETGVWNTTAEVDATYELNGRFNASLNGKETLLSTNTYWTVYNQTGSDAAAIGAAMDSIAKSMSKNGTVTSN